MTPSMNECCFVCKFLVIQFWKKKMIVSTQRFSNHLIKDGSYDFARAREGLNENTAWHSVDVFLSTVMLRAGQMCIG